MAEIMSPSGANHPHAGARRAKRLSTRVDLTPMVDLGFLLIIFFIFTTTLSEPRAINLVMPADGPATPIPKSKTLNLVLAADNKIHYYVGNEVWKQSCTDFSTEGVRKVITEMQQKIHQRYGDRSQLIVLIRPTPQSSYLNLVDILDEMLILDVKKYALLDDVPAETNSTADIPKPC